jgi:hypothetical protein
MDMLQKLIRQLHRKRILGEFIQISGVSFLVGVFAYVFSLDSSVAPLIIGGAFFVGSTAIAFITGRFNKPSPEEITRFLDRTYPFMEESSFLFLNEPDEETMEAWQKEKISKKLNEFADQIILPNESLKKAGRMGGLWMALSLILLVSKPVLNDALKSVALTRAEQVQEEKAVESEQNIPELTEVQIKITPPPYTGLSNRTSGFENISIPEQSRMEWNTKTEGDYENVHLLFSNGEKLLLDSDSEAGDYFVSMEATENRIYQIVLSAADTTIYSAFKSIEVIADQPPGFAVEKPVEKRDFITKGKRDFDIEATVGDDYGITNTKINATLAQGSGENVRFREQSFSFDDLSGLGTQEVKASATLNADDLEMEPGDELYFFITATDNKPEPQIARSDTYFIIYTDSAEVSTVEIAGLGVDLLPEYFRSQRQIIIDTEQLLEDEPNISRVEFNRRSENIGHDQNLLRKRYGEYLGMEDEMESSAETDAISDGGGADLGEAEAADDHDHEGEEVNEMGLSSAESEVAGIIPDEFFHDHGAAEMNTLFAESPRALLKQSLDNMWNAEMYLRIRRPQEALPYEYAALEYLKAVQQANRQYTRKAGYELPPIPEEEKRLTGTYDDFAGPEGSLQTNRPTDPLEQLQLLLEDRTLAASELAEEGRSLILQSELTDANRLFLLNRLRGIENDGRDNQVEQQINKLISELADELQLDPAPRTRPVLPNIQSEQ